MVDSRNLIVAAARWAVNRKNDGRYNWHYKEIRPIPLNLVFPKWTDCSGFVTWCYWVAGCNDPNGLNFDGQGYTGTLLSHGKHINPAQVVPGDVVVYGPGTGDHTALVVQVDGYNIMTVSNGQEGDPSWVWVNKPHNPPISEMSVTAVDGRTPQTFLRFDTSQHHNPQVLPL
jgi:CHAP domain